MTTPTRLEEARRILGLRLQKLRLDAHLTAHGLAEAIGCHDAVVELVEKGQQPAGDDLVKRWVTVCGAAGQVASLVALGRGIEEVFTPSQGEAAAGDCSVQRGFHPMYRATSQFRVLQLTFLPSLLQTERYARAYLSTLSLRSGGVPLEDAVSARMELQQYLQDSGKKFTFLLGETALRNRVAPALVMADQLVHLLEVKRQPNLTVGVLPLDAELPFYPWESFWIYDEVEVRADGVTKQIRMRTPEELETYTKIFTALAEVAVYGEGASQLIAQARRHVVEEL